MADNFGISQPVRRREDIRFVTGRGCFSDDIKVSGQVYAHFVRSKYPHGILRTVNFGRARIMPGVLGIFTSDDLHAAGVGPIQFMPILGFPMNAPVDTPRHALALNRVRYVGEQVAVVIAETLSQAIDAADEAEVAIDPLAAVANIEQAVAPSPQAIWPLAPDNVVLTWRFGDTSLVNAAFARAAHITRLRLVNNRVAANAPEPRTSIAGYDAAAGRYSMTISSQGVLYFLRGLCEYTLRLAPDKIHLRTHDVGGRSAQRNCLIRRTSQFYMLHEFSAAPSNGPARAANNSFPIITRATHSSTVRWL